ncbi:RNA-dependent RNA polymerase 2-like [Primulina tabacum]|uniref:RNA-dependent RNA polymerase 2-like n=1 Tax=Primulina tabacum TaxID=48773 RepID=UPI003F5A0E92
MAVDFAKTGAPAVMPRFLKLREFPDFMERWEKPMYIFQGALGKLYRVTIQFVQQTKPDDEPYQKILAEAYDPDLIVDGYETFLETAESHKEQYGEVKHRILAFVKTLTKDVKELFESSEGEREKLASAWYHVTYHPNYSEGSSCCLGFPWVVGEILLKIKSTRRCMIIVYARRSSCTNDAFGDGI